MEIIGCGKGHYYNPELYSSCPECAKERGTVDTLGPTEFAGFGNFAGSASDSGPTEAVNWGKYPNSISDISTTEAVDFDKYAGNSNSIPKTEPVSPVPNRIVETYEFLDKKERSKVEDYGPTEYVGSADAPKKGIPFMPVVGWLVCIEGSAKGRDYKIHSQYNYIGRAQHMDICISGDPCISAERAAVIAYDPKKKIFSFAPGNSLNLVYLNDDMLMNPVILKSHDVLTIGDTKLLFVPL